MAYDLKVSWRGRDDAIPESVRKIAAGRVRDMIDFYGRFIRTITIEQLAESCYLQGVEDALQVAVKESLARRESLDFQI